LCRKLVCHEFGENVLPIFNIKFNETPFAILIHLNYETGEKIMTNVIPEICVALAEQIIRNLSEDYRRDR